jgi:hypothetical protein
MGKIDHIILAAADLESGILRAEELLGVRAVPGGSHPAHGTRNALLSLGEDSYLEIIGPDPEQPKPEGPRVFRVDEVDTPRLTTWAAKESDLEGRIESAASRSLHFGEILSGGRKTPEGGFLAWRVSDPRVMIGDGIVPFLIDWGETPHPAATAPRGGKLVGLRAQHPDPEAVRALLAAADLDLVVEPGPEPALIAAIESASGLVELR